MPVATQDSTSWVRQGALPSGITYRNEDTYRYIGTESLKLGGYSFSTVKISALVRSWTNGVENDYSGETITYWFGYETGWYVQTYKPPYRAKSGQMYGGFKIVLDGYTLK
jgi:hypothetical protein